MDAAQSRMERRLEGEESQPLASLTQALGLGILVDLEALLRSNLTQLQAFISAFHSLRQQVRSVAHSYHDEVARRPKLGLAVRLTRVTAVV